MASQPWGITWRKAIVSLPRLVPDAVLRFTSPGGPQPFVVQLPSRGEHLIPLYVFVPPGLTSSTSNNPSTSLPVLIDFHGGGFVLGSCHEQAPFCAKMCRELNCVAISVDYRLGPYAQFPAALEDAEDVVNAILKSDMPGYARLRGGINDHLAKKSRPDITLDTKNIALSGFSSGGNLALNLVMNMYPPQVSSPWLCPFPSDYPNDIPVLMYYAAIDLRKLPSEREIVEHMHEVPKSFVASMELEQNLMPTYIPRGMVSNPRASPALAEVKNGGLHEKAKCLLLLAERDSLNIQNEDWIQKAVDAGRGADVRVQKYLGVSHGFTQFPDSWLDASALNNKHEAYNRAGEFLRSFWCQEQQSES